MKKSSLRNMKHLDKLDSVERKKRHESVRGHATPVYVGKTGQAYITTLSPPLPGYLVRIPDVARSGKYRQKAFRSKTIEPHDLLKAAIKWRDEILLVQTGTPTIPYRVFHERQANSRTGIPGIRKIRKKVLKKKTDGTATTYFIDCIIAEIWLIPGKAGKRPTQSRSRVFSLNKYTEQEALLMAIQWREDQICRLSDPPEGPN